jgi:uncharacterized protein
LTSHFILYVRNQEISTRFYERVLGFPPRLNVPGMTEFQLSAHAVLGLMPEKGIARILGESLVDPEKSGQPPRAELYLLVENVGVAITRATDAGAVEVSKLAVRDWGHRAAYFLDPDNHVLALAEVIGEKKF